MDPDYTHPEYSAMANTWQKCRDTAVGLRAVSARGPTYLPLLGGHKDRNDEDYLAYKKRAQFFDAVSITIDTMAGHIFRKQPIIKMPAALEKLTKDITMSGISLEGFITDLTDEVLEVGRCGILVEYPQKSTDELVTLSKVEELGLRPYLTSYRAENIINWKIGRVNNASVPINIWLKETYEEDDEEKEQIRELFLEGSYGQRLWKKSEKGWYVAETINPVKNGKGINRIPFYVVGVKEKGLEVQKPPLEGLAETSLGYYRNSADYEQGLHVLGLPTPWINGIDNKDDAPEVHLGPGTVMMLPTGAQAGMLQAGSDGVAAHKEAMQEKKQEMASQGAQMLKEEKRVAESGNSLAIKRGGENSILASIAGSVEKTVERALQFMAEWLGGNPNDVSVQLNKDYLPSAMNPNMLREWRASYLEDTISYETYFEGLIRGELVSEGKTADDERARIDEQAPALGTITNDDQ